MIGSSDVLLERNIFRRNNVEELTGYYPAAVKIFNQSHRVTCRDNLVLDNPNSNGIWYDVGNRDGVFVNNWIQDALVGFFFEISKGATVAGNVFVRCGRGLWALNSSNVRVYHNTFVDTVASFERNERSARATTSAGTRRPAPTSTSARGTSSSATCSWRASRSASRCCAFEQPKALCARLTRPQVDAGGRQRLRARREAAGAAPRLEPGRRRELPGRARLARGAAEAAAGARGARPRLRRLGGRSLPQPRARRTTSWRSRCPGPAAGGRPAGRGGAAARLAGRPSRGRRARSRSARRRRPADAAGW